MVINLINIIKLGYKSSMGKEFYPSLISVIWKKIEKNKGF